MREHLKLILIKTPRNLTELKEGGISIVLELNLIRIGWDL